MGIKRLLCISPGGAAAVHARCGPLRDWDLCIVGTLADAARALHQQRYLAGLLLDNGGGDAAALDVFFRAHWRTRWVGVFEAGLMDNA